MNDQVRKLEWMFESNPSSLIKAARYDRFSSALSLDFKTTKAGMSYTYFEVPEEVARQLFEAESPGTYFQTKIKGKYTFVTKAQRLSEEKPTTDETSNIQTTVTKDSDEHK
jgi:hypothetical protein